MPADSVDEVISAAPIERVKTGVRTVVEFNAYPDGHSGIAVGNFTSPPGTRGPLTYVRETSLPLNDRAELEQAIAGILDRLFGEA